MSVFEVTAIVAATALTCLLSWYVRRLHADANARATYEDRFFEAAGRLLDRDDFPRSIDPMVALMSETIGDRRFLPAFLKSTLSGDLRRQLQHTRKSGSSFTAFEDPVPEDLRETFVEMMRNWMLALSHTHVIRGWVFRNLVPLVFAKPSRGAVEPQVKVYIDRIRRDGAAAPA